MSAIFELLRGSVDYAGLFPPAALPMVEVVNNYSQYLKSEERAMLGRLIIPAGRLEEFEDAARDLLPTDNTTSPWRISALVPPIEQANGNLDVAKFEMAIAAINAFNNKHLTEGDVAVLVDAIEVKTSGQEVIQATIEKLPKGISSFLEVSSTSPVLESLIQTIAKNKSNKPIFAKIRTGGVTPDLIPPVQCLAEFITACVQHKLGFKATAGLHHPLRGEQKLTYAKDAPSGVMHGFLNVFLGTMMTFEHGITKQQLTELLSHDSPDSFEFEGDSINYNSLSISASRIQEIRNTGIVSFGSCSFSEPTTELQDLPSITHEAVFPS